jgi:hypothetical protein
MPQIGTVNGASIVIYYNDFEPPHFWVYFRSEFAMVGIADLQVLAGNLSPRMESAVLHWALPRQKALALEWAKARGQLPLGKV